MTKAYSATKIFTGESYIYDHAVITEDGVVTDIVPANHLPGDIEHTSYGEHTIVPAFIDIQIYGAGGKLLAMHPDVDALQRLYTYCFDGGAHHFLPTVATNTYQVFYDCIDAVRAYWKGNGQGVLGLHIEGPWINVVKRGAHIKELIHSPTVEQVTALLEYGKGVIKMITLAPEVCTQQVIDLVLSHGIIVSAGHSNATFQQATTAFDNGIVMATHLFNAMSPLQHRQPGLAGAVMHHHAAMSSIIPDGHHVDFEVISIAKKVMNERLFMITDAVTETPDGPYPHQLDGDKYVANGILSGSALTMLKGVKNCIDHVGISQAEALRMASAYPAKIMGLENKLGSIKKGAATHWLVLNNDMEIVDHVKASS